MKKSILIFITTLTLFTACQKVVDADGLLDIEETVYITSYISPQDTVLRVNVSRALPAIGTPLSVRDQEANQAKFLITNAQVTISDEAGHSTTLFYSEEKNTYLAAASALSVLSNQRYFLKVLIEGKEFNATCTIPTKISEINERINLRDGNFGRQEVDINLSFQDILGKKNFYVLGGLVETTVQYEGEEPQVFDFALFFDSDEFLSDNLEDGGVLNGNSISYVGNDVEVLGTKIILQVANVEETLFQNLRTASTNNDADGNPFVEYAIAPNNFSEEGVIGVFAGYQLTQKEIDLEL